MGLFERNLGIWFLGDRILNQSQDLNLKIKDFEVKNDPFKAPKVTKSAKIIPLPNTGYSGRFQNLPKFVTKVWKVGFLCYVL